MGTQQMLLDVDQSDLAIIQYLCEQSGKLYNTGTYFARQVFFKTNRLLSKFDLDYEPTVAKTQLARSLPSTPAQQTLRSVTEAVASYRELRKLWFEEGCKPDKKPQFPGYLEGKRLFKVAFPNSGGQKPKVIGGQLRFSLGRAVKRWFGVQYLFLDLPTNINPKRVKEWTILPKNGSFYLEATYELQRQEHDLDPKEVLSIDLGTADNLAACVSTKGTSLLIDSRQMKAMNQLWNKKVATRKEGKDQGYWDSWLDRVTRIRNNQMRDGINKAAKLIIQHCIDNGIGTLVLGWNDDFQVNANLGRLNNQKFVQMPLGKLKKRLEQLCQLHGIEFVTTEEAYTSKASYLDGDSLPEYGNKPDGWKASGKRVERGLYRSADGSLVNADLNGAANILRKVASNLDLDLSRLGRRCLTTVARKRLWATPKSTPVSRIPAHS